MSGTMVRSSQLELLDRINFVAQMLGAEMPEYIIREKLQEKYGICRRQVNSYVARARVLMRQRTGKSRFDHRVESDSFYRSELQRSADPVVRIKCRERLDAIHGVDAKYEGGAAIPDDVSRDEYGVPIDRSRRLEAAMALLNSAAAREVPEADRAADDVVHSSGAIPEASPIPSS